MKQSHRPQAKGSGEPGTAGQDPDTLTAPEGAAHVGEAARFHPKEPQKGAGHGERIRNSPPASIDGAGQDREALKEQPTESKEG